MVIKELIGIYLEKDALHYCCAARTISSWQMAIPGSAMDPSGVLHGSALAILREFLQRFSPKIGRQIFLALPRSRFFIRDVQLPPVPIEDALVSVQSVLPVTSHLPLDDIFHDIYLCRIPDGKVNALVIYALHKEIQPVLEIFREIGHEKSLAGLFPISLGIGAWLDLQQYEMPMGLAISQESSAYELALYQKSGCVYSTSWQNAFHVDDISDRVESACAKFGLSADNVYGFGHPEVCLSLPEPLQNKLPWLPSIRQNPGAAALATALSNQQQILLNADLPRIKVFRLWKLFVPFALVLSAILYVWTVKMNHAIEHESVSVSIMKDETQQLQQRVRPLEKTRDALKKAKSLSSDIEDFIRLRPRLYSCFNEIARLVPEGTWFSRSSFQGAELTLQGQSKDALKVMESLRTSTMFEQVKLVGSVSRNPAGTEQFSLTIRLKDVEANP
jgi:Tfp pilus assembly protein PilN